MVGKINNLVGKINNLVGKINNFIDYEYVRFCPFRACLELLQFLPD